MPAAVPTINGVAGSNADLPINTLVQLNNTGSGGELTYAWAILDQPTGAADVLSSASIVNPTFTPTKEGSYLIELVVNSGLPSEVRATVIVGIKELRSGLRIPAAGETDEVDASDGWAPTVAALLRAGANQLYDGTVLGVLAGAYSAGTVVYGSGRSTLKSGLPGEEILPTYTVAPASTAALMARPLAIIESGVAGVLTLGAVVRARTLGRLAGLGIVGAAVGDAIYVTNAGALSLTAGTNVRQVGVVMWTNGTICDAWIDTTSGAFSSAHLYAPWMTGPVDVEALPQTLVFNAAAGVTPTVEIIGSTGGAGTDTAFYLHSPDGSGNWGYFWITKEGEVNIGSDGAITADAYVRLKSRSAGVDYTHSLQSQSNNLAVIAPAGTSIFKLTNYGELSADPELLTLNAAAVGGSVSGSTISMRTATTAGSYEAQVEMAATALGGADANAALAFVAKDFAGNGGSFDFRLNEHTDLSTHYTRFALYGFTSDLTQVELQIDCTADEGYFRDTNSNSTLTAWTFEFTNLTIRSLANPAADGEALSWGYAKTAFAPAIVVWGANAVPAAGVTGYLYPGYSPAAPMATEVVRWRAPYAGKVDNTYVRADTGSVTDLWTVSVRKNGAAAVTFNIGAGVTTANDGTNFTFVAGDELTVSVASAAGVTVPATEPTVTLGIVLA